MSKNDIKIILPEGASDGHRHPNPECLRLYFVLLLVFVAMGLFTFLTQKFKDNRPVDAANAWNFDPGYIISDWQMGNANSMSEAQIQAFLTQKNPCSNRNYNEYQYQSSTFPGVKWHWNDGHFVCISEERFGNGTQIGSGETAAHIIWQAAQDYQINPQVLIVLLEKENGLITDTFPHSGQYKTATGFGCPDTAACEEKYFGFKNQVRLAAKLFHEVLTGGWSNYVVGSNYVQYNPNKDCGGTWVNIRNRATASLYRYTPYQPNSAALGAGYGVGDSCSAYGNRNFYLWFEDWFGNIKAEAPVMPTSAKIEEGVYTIQSALASTKMMDVANGSSKNSTNVWLYSNNDSGAQEWQIIDNKDGTYTVKNPQSGKVLDVASASTKNGANVQMYESNKTCAQKWIIAKNDDNTYTLYSSCSGKAADVNGGSMQDTTNIQLYESNRTVAQKWVIKKKVTQTSQQAQQTQQVKPTEVIEEGVYTVRSALDNNKVLDVANGAESSRDGTNIQLYTANATEAQKWKVKKNVDGTYTLINPYSGRALDVANGSKKMGTNVQVWAQNGTCAQKWKVVKNADKTYSFYSSCSDLALDVDNSKTTDGTNVKLWDNNGYKAQRWVLTK